MSRTKTYSINLRKSCDSNYRLGNLMLAGKWLMMALNEGIMTADGATSTNPHTWTWAWAAIIFILSPLTTNRTQSVCIFLLQILLDSIRSHSIVPIPSSTTVCAQALVFILIISQDMDFVIDSRHTHRFLWNIFIFFNKFYPTLTALE